MKKAHRFSDIVWNDRSHRQKNNRALTLRRNKRTRRLLQRVRGSVSLLVRKSTRQEELLRGALIAKRVLFDFQRPIVSRTTGKYRVADFYFPRGRELSLVVEIDGRSHHGRGEDDQKRDEWIRSMTGATIRRFTNEEVDRDVLAVVNQICSWGVLYREE